MNHEYYEQILSIKKTKAGLLNILRNNKKFSGVIIAYFTTGLLILLLSVLFSLKIFDENISSFLVILIVSLTIVLFLIMNNPNTSAYIISTNSKRKEKLSKLLSLSEITHSTEINKLQNLVEHWANQREPRKFNWTIVLIFYSVIYTSFMTQLVKDFLLDFKVEYIFTLIFIAIVFHSIFYIIKSFVEILVFGKLESEYQFLIWVSGELKAAELEALLQENKKSR